MRHSCRPDGPLAVAGRPMRGATHATNTSTMRPLFRRKLPTQPQCSLATHSPLTSQAPAQQLLDRAPHIRKSLYISTPVSAQLGLSAQRQPDRRSTICNATAVVADIITPEAVQSLNVPQLISLLEQMAFASDGTPVKPKADTVLQQIFTIWSSDGPPEEGLTDEDRKGYKSAQLARVAWATRELSKRSEISTEMASKLLTDCTVLTCRTESVNLDSMVRLVHSLAAMGQHWASGWLVRELQRWWWTPASEEQLLSIVEACAAEQDTAIISVELIDEVMTLVLLSMATWSPEQIRRLTAALMRLRYPLVSENPGILEAVHGHSLGARLDDTSGQGRRPPAVVLASILLKKVDAKNPRTLPPVTCLARISAQCARHDLPDLLPPGTFEALVSVVMDAVAAGPVDPSHPADILWACAVLDKFLLDADVDLLADPVVMHLGAEVGKKQDHGAVYGSLDRWAPEHLRRFLQAMAVLGVPLQPELVKGWAEGCADWARGQAASGSAHWSERDVWQVSRIVIAVAAMAGQAGTEGSQRQLVGLLVKKLEVLERDLQGPTINDLEEVWAMVQALSEDEEVDWLLDMLGSRELAPPRDGGEEGAFPPAPASILQDLLKSALNGLYAPICPEFLEFQLWPWMKANPGKVDQILIKQIQEVYQVPEEARLA